MGEGQGEKLGSAYVEIQAKLDGFHRGLNRAHGEFQRFASGMNARAASMAADIGGQLAGIAGGLTGMVGRMGLGAIAAGTAAMGAGLAHAVSSSADLQESISKTGQVFEDKAGVVTKAADDMAKKFGTNKQTFLDAASGIGLILQGSGQAVKQSADLSVSLVKLADDAASFYDTGMDEALTKIRAGLVGESEPLRAFGVLLSEQAVKARAATLGFKKLSEAAKVTARISIIEEGLQKAKGDRERTGGSTKNTGRAIVGKIGNMMTDLGTTLQPITDMVLKMVGGMVSRISAFFEEHKGSIQAWAEQMRVSVADAILRVQEFYQSLKMFLGSSSGQMILKTLAGAFTWVKDAIVEAVDTVAFAMRNWQDLTEVLALMWGEKLTNMVETVQWLGEQIGVFLGWFGQNWQQVFREAIEAAARMLWNLNQNFADFGAALAKFVANGFQGGLDFNMTPILQGFESKLTMPEFKPLQLSSFEEQMNQVYDRINKREEEWAKQHNKNLQDATKKPEEKTNPDRLPPLKIKDKEKSTKAEFVGLDEFSRKIQLGIFKEDKNAAETARNTAETAAGVKELGDQVGRLAGGGIVAVAAR